MGRGLIELRPESASLGADCPCSLDRRACILSVREKPMRTQVAIVGGGPAGLLLSQLLHVAGIDSVVLERRSRDYVEARIRAGGLEQVTVDLLEQAGAGARMRREGLPHGGVNLASDGESFRIDFERLIGKSVMVYGQTEVTHDLNALLAERGQPMFEAEDVALHDIE